MKKVFISVLIVCCWVLNVSGETNLCDENASSSEYYFYRTRGVAVDKVIPLFRFKDDVVGQFLKCFFTSAGTHEAMFLDKVEYIGFPHDGDVKDYIYVRNMNPKHEHIELATAAIALPESKIILLPEVNDSLKQMLHIEQDGTASLHYGVSEGGTESYYWFEPTEALIHIMPSGKVDPVYIYDDREDSDEKYYNWIEQYYKTNLLNPGVTYKNRPRSIERLGLLSDSIPKDIKIGYSPYKTEPDRLKDLVQMKVEDIIKLKHLSSSRVVGILFPPMSKGELDKRIKMFQNQFKH